MPEKYNKEGRTNPLAWSFHQDSKYYNSFSKLIRYEGFLQREFSRALRELRMMQEDRRARQAEAAAAEAEAAARHAEPAPSEPEAPPAAPRTEKTNRTQFPEGTAASNAGVTPGQRQNPSPNLPSGGS